MSSYYTAEEGSISERDWESAEEYLPGNDEHHDGATQQEPAEEDDPELAAVKEHMRKVMYRQDTFTNGYDLRQWDPFPRKEMATDEEIVLNLIEDGVTRTVSMPMIPFFAASPVFQDHMLGDPAAIILNVDNKDITVEAMSTLAQWLRDICKQDVVQPIPIPTEFIRAMKLRLAAHKFGMHQYVNHIDAKYLQRVAAVFPEPWEIDAVLRYTADEEEDDVRLLAAVANRIAYLYRYNKVPQSKRTLYQRVLADAEYARYQRLVQEDVVQAMAAGDRRGG
ncbi:hypothetical protein IQ07DRAFT_641398 [Pyrenochaeta sp. DS3sAY3a]|nr:hypothetical protein IQ07DRAFT_641398 [Pyrenochaeta sp. DS3sAY3a]